MGEHVSEFLGDLVGFASLAAIMGFFMWAIYSLLRSMDRDRMCPCLSNTCIDYR
ncbi:uncharacterized protein LAESUDRAFT_731494 [Laetiporus sulphureus 93-53]|uniref:Uncharacterized protein n=1 Tax=Laetiporus sulphureus 93-53 TaxID=1314785 RepID=A0A165BIR2_9APHY|nr:uncharacterized protein LAESUDRAFT_731494 [Laetiporus sulphureus 93-53]KZT01134.1 hypothetical protein LAESUDRAFT_731494 [Laetiporus sulphureus 93-53]